MSTHAFVEEVPEECAPRNMNAEDYKDDEDGPFSNFPRRVAKLKAQAERQAQNRKIQEKYSRERIQALKDLRAFEAQLKTDIKYSTRPSRWKTYEQKGEDQLKSMISFYNHGILSMLDMLRYRTSKLRPELNFGACRRDLVERAQEAEQVRLDAEVDAQEAFEDEKKDLDFCDSDMARDFMWPGEYGGQDLLTEEQEELLKKQEDEARAKYEKMQAFWSKREDSQSNLRSNPPKQVPKMGKREPDAIKATAWTKEHLEELWDLEERLKYDRLKYNHRSGIEADGIASTALVNACSELQGRDELPVNDNLSRAHYVTEGILERSGWKHEVVVQLLGLEQQQVVEEDEIKTHNLSIREYKNGEELQPKPPQEETVKEYKTRVKREGELRRQKLAEEMAERKAVELFIMRYTMELGREISQGQRLELIKQWKKNHKKVKGAREGARRLGFELPILSFQNWK